MMASHIPNDEEIIAICKKIKVPGGGRFTKISDSACVKFGLDMTPAEASTQEWAWKHVDRKVFQVPQPYRFFQDKSRGPHMIKGYLVMEYIDGMSMSDYLEHATPSEREATVDAIMAILAHLAKVPVPIGQGPGPVGGGSPRCYLWSDTGIASTFTSLMDLQETLNHILTTYHQGRGYHGELFDFSALELFMCHGDLAPRNIIRKPNGELVVIDWAYGGFFPRLFEIYAFRTRVDREPLFAQVLSRLENTYDENQIQLLGKIERLFLHYGNGINRSLASSSQPVIVDKISSRAPPPPPPPVRGLFINGKFARDDPLTREIKQDNP